MARFIAILLTAASVALIALPLPAYAAYPGANGRIAFVRGSSCDRDIYSVQSDGAGEVRLTDSAGRDTDPAWSPDGEWIAYRSHRDEDRCDSFFGEVYLMAGDGSQQTRLTQNVEIADRSPTWSPDGNWLEFVSNRLPAPNEHPCGDYYQRHDVYRMSSDGSGVTRLTANTEHETGIAWSPDGLKLAVRFELYRFPPDVCSPELYQSGSRTIGPWGAAGIYDEGGEDWSPDSRRMAWAQSGDIWVGDLMRPGTNVTRTSGIVESDPAWSPDGTRIVFARRMTSAYESTELFLMDPDGSGQMQLTSNSVMESQPDWQPAGGSYPRPKGASPVRVALVPEFDQCTAPNREHGPPLAFGACAPPRLGTPLMTIGGPDAGEGPARAVGSVRLAAVRGPLGPPEEADLRLSVQLTNVLERAGLSDYDGELLAEFYVRITDREGAIASTSIDMPFSFEVGCVPTSDTDMGAVCRAETSADALMPGTVNEGGRAIWQLGQLRVTDGGDDRDGETLGDNHPFVTQGVFVP